MLRHVVLRGVMYIMVAWCCGVLCYTVICCVLYHVLCVVLCCATLCYVVLCYNAYVVSGIRYIMCCCVVWCCDMLCCVV